MEKLLNKLLADLVVEYHKLQHFHWYIKGADFFQVHAQLETYYDEINGAVDEVAELMLQNSLKPASTLKEFLEITGISEAEGDFTASGPVLKAVLADYRYLSDSVKAVKAAAEKEKNDLVATKMDDYIAAFSKAVWMLSQAQ